MSIERKTMNTLSNFSIWAAQKLVPTYFKYWELYSYASTVYGIRFYFDEPVYTLLEDETAPTGWSTNYNNYYTKVGDEYYKNDFESDPGYEANVYYSRTDPTKKALQIGKDAADSQKFGVKVWKNATGSPVSIVTDSLSSPDSYLTFKADGGIFIRISYGTTYIYDVIIAKTNNGETAVIFNNVCTSNAIDVSKYMTNVNCVAWGDDMSSNKQLSWLSQEQNQTQLVPFTTYAEYGNVSYTPTAFYCPKSSVYALRNHTVVYDEIYYVTNGYWMIKDEEPVIPEPNET